MDYVIRGLGFVIIPVIVGGILAFLRYPKKAEKGKVYLPKFIAILGLIISTLFLIPTFITAFSDEPIWLPICYFAFSSLGAVFVIAFVDCRVQYNADRFVVKSFFGIKRSYTYDQVTAIKEGMHEDFIYVGKRRVMIDEFAVGGIEFIVFVKKQYRKTHNGQSLPEIHKSKRDIFNGNVEDVFGFVFVYILVGVFILAFAVFVVWNVFLSPNTVDNTLEKQVTFVSCEAKGDDILLISSEGQRYEIQTVGDDFNITPLAAVCDGKTLLTVYVKEITPDKGEDFYSVKAISNGQNALLQFDDVNRWHREEYGLLLLFPAVFAVFWGTYVTGSIIVGRNPKKYSKKIVRLFFKEGYIND